MTETNGKPEELSVLDAFKVRHSTRNFSKAPWEPELQDFVAKTVEEANQLPRLFGGRAEIVLAPTGFGLLNFIVNEVGWLLAKTPTSTDLEVQKRDVLEIGHLLQYCVIRLTQHGIATCWIAGTFKKEKSIEFCEGACDVKAAVAFGGYDNDRLLDKTVKFFGWFRGSNTYKDKFYDAKEKRAITEEDVGEREGLCLAAAKIPCAMKPHAYRIIFDEPNVHIFNTSEWQMSNFDMGIVVADFKMYLESIGQTFEMQILESHPEYPTGGEYLCTVVIGK